MKRKLFVAMLVFCLFTGADDALAQGARRRHEPREQLEYCLSRDKFAILYNKVKETSFDDRKMDLIEVASLGAYYTCEQCASIISIFSFGDKKLAALRLMAPRIVDPRHAGLIYEKFSFLSEREEAARLLGRCGCRD